MSAAFDNLVICETFYSIQGEGASVGKPSIFLRLAACNLDCLGFSYRCPETGEHLGCDSKLVWRQGVRRAHDDILQEFSDNGWLEKLKEGAHLIITGGEPSLQQKKLLEFIKLLEANLGLLPYIELETNATIPLLPNFTDKLSQINASPKLSNSGETRQKALVPHSIESLINLPIAYFKFVIKTPSDIEEIINDFIIPFQIEHNRVWLMAEGGTSAAVHEKAQFIVEICKKFNMNYSPRIHIDIWGEVTGV